MINDLGFNFRHAKDLLGINLLGLMRYYSSKVRICVFTNEWLKRIIVDECQKN